MIYPADVKGKHRTRRTIIESLLLLVFLITPWIPFQGKQAILLDFYNGKFDFFSLHFSAQDIPILFLVFGGLAILLALITAIWGRIWCGWACPQTVFIDLVFRRIESWLEGDHIQRRKQADEAMTTSLFFRKSAKWSLFTLCSMIIAHSFLAVFVGTEQIKTIVTSPPSDHPGSLLFVSIIVGGTLFNFGWFREKFCTLICPYGKLQSILISPKSLIIAYDQKRGEPRKIKNMSTPPGDCINCGRCVQVCPTGIDIRDGLQLECIACTACADACDDVMKRLKRPEGLIRYDTTEGLEGKGRSRIGIQSLLYLVVLIVLMGSLTYILSFRGDIRLNISRPVGAPYQEVSDDQVANHLVVTITNQTKDTRTVQLRLSRESENAGITLISQTTEVLLHASQTLRRDFFIRFPIEALKNGSLTIPLIVVDENSQKNYSEDVILVGPRR